MFNLKPFFFKSLPDFFHETDSYKDGDGKGLLERYLETFEEELQSPLEDIKSSDGTSGLPTLIQPLEVPEQFLSLLGSFYGNPPKLVENPTFYRKLLKESIWIYKERGKISAIEKFFNLFNIQVAIEIEDIGSNTYDSIQYDDGINYDTQTQYCRAYTITLSDPGSILGGLTPPNVNLHLQENLYKVLSFLMPINTILTSYTYNSGTPD